MAVSTPRHAIIDYDGTVTDPGQSPGYRVSIQYRGQLVEGTGRTIWLAMRDLSEELERVDKGAK